MNKIKIFTDSSVDPKLKVGFGAFLVLENIEKHNNDDEHGKHDEHIETKQFIDTSSTKLELQTFLWAFDEVSSKYDLSNIAFEVYTDCQNIVQLEKRREKLENNDYKSKTGKESKNKDLYKRFFKIIDSCEITFIKVKGHKKNSLKDSVDKIFNLVDKQSRHELREYLQKNKKFYDKDLLEIKEHIIDELKDSNEVSFEVLNPDFCDSVYSGTKVQVENKIMIYRSYKVWQDLANILKCKFLTPVFIDKHLVLIKYKKLDENISFHNFDDDKEKYGIASEFAKINKNEEISFLHYYTQALQNVSFEKRIRILNLGVNDASEIDILKKLDCKFEEKEVVGIDYSKSAIEFAQNKYKHLKNVKFYNEDINNLEKLELDKFDLIISIGTLQSSNLNFNETFMSLVQNHLKKDGAIVLGFPNSRWIDGELIYGAMIKNYTFSEMSNLYKDVVFCKKYLQQKKFRVMITGKEYIFLSATSIKK